jgi:hypothetical protein
MVFGYDSAIFKSKSRKLHELEIHFTSFWHLKFTGEESDFWHAKIVHPVFISYLIQNFQILVYWLLMIVKFSIRKSHGQGTEMTNKN